jgi:sugar phosphate isomerase/epimerase
MDIYFKALFAKREAIIHRSSYSGVIVLKSHYLKSIQERTDMATRRSIVARYAYVLPGPNAYSDRKSFESDLVAVKQSGYDAVELQIADPAQINEEALRESLERAGLPLCAVQTGGTYATLGNCLCTADDTRRERTMQLLRRFVDFASHFDVVLVFGSLQGRQSDEPDLHNGHNRILSAMREIAAYASRFHVTIAYEPVNHMEVGWHHTIAEVAALVREINEPSLKLMFDTFHMNIEEKDLFHPLSEFKDLLAHIHLSDTNRDVLGSCRWPTAEFLDALEHIDYSGVVSVGVYNTSLTIQESMRFSMDAVREAVIRPS